MLRIDAKVCHVEVAGVPTGQKVPESAMDDRRVACLERTLPRSLGNRALACLLAAGGRMRGGLSDLFQLRSVRLVGTTGWHRDYE